MLPGPCGLERLDTSCTRELVVATRGLKVGSCRSHRGVGISASTDSSSRTLFFTLIGVILCCSDNGDGPVKGTWSDVTPSLLKELLLMLSMLLLVVELLVQ